MTVSGLADRRALISGGSRGLGLGIARALLAEGCRVAAFSRKASPEVEALVAANEGRMAFRAADLGDAEGAAEVARWAEGALGGIDFLVNNAGVLHESLL